jgi:CheY-like chemotaxis protein
VKKRRWILLVEDNANDADLTLRALKSGDSPCDVLHTNDGSEALDCLCRRGRFAQCEDEYPAVVLLDLKMPKVDGFEVLRQIRMDEHLRSIPVVIFTSSREESDVSRSYRLGANAYVAKPVDFDQFLNALTLLRKFWISINEPPSDDPL